MGITRLPCWKAYESSSKALTRLLRCKSYMDIMRKRVDGMEDVPHRFLQPLSIPFGIMRNGAWGQSPRLQENLQAHGTFPFVFEPSDCSTAKEPELVRHVSIAVPSSEFLLQNESVHISEGFVKVVLVIRPNAAKPISRALCSHVQATTNPASEHILRRRY